MAVAKTGALNRFTSSEKSKMEPAKFCTLISFAILNTVCQILHSLLSLKNKNKDGP